MLCRDDVIYTSMERGIKPLLNLLNGNADISGFSAADKIVGRAAAFLYVLMGVEAVYADVMAKAAADILEKYGISPSSGISVASIRNRADTGICPMEQAVEGISDPREALAAVTEKLKQLQQGK